MPLYDVKNPLDRASNTAGSAMQGYSALAGMQPPEKTTGGGLMAGMGGAASGAMIGTALGGPGIGTAVGAGIINDGARRCRH